MDPHYFVKGKNIILNVKVLLRSVLRKYIFLFRLQKTFKIPYIASNQIYSLMKDPKSTKVN